MRKKLFLILVFIDFLFLIFLLLNAYLFFWIFLFCNIIVVIIFLKVYFKTNVINIGKIKNVIKTNKIRKLISKDEKYMEKIKIDTFDGSGGTTHPCIMLFEKKYNNYKYYLIHTPYDNHNTELENPSLCVSNDGETFIYPKGINNPLLPISKRDKSKVAKYYNDNFLLYENKELQVWYRYTIENKSKDNPSLFHQLYRIKTINGVDFTEPELMIDNDGIWYLSSSIIKIGKTYYLYYFDKDYKMHCRTSNDLYDWDKPINVEINNYKGNIWHGEVKVYNKKLYLLFLSKDYNLYWCSTDISRPFEFKKCNKINLTYYDEYQMYGNEHPYKSTFLLDNEYIYLYIPYVVNTINISKLRRHTKWTMTYTKLKINNFNKYIKE